MSPLAAVNLPIELILLATEYAAWDDLDAQMQTSEKAIRRWYHWVASLCTVCRALEPSMARILYTLVHVHPGNVDAVVRAAEMDTHPFRRARAVYFDLRGTLLADDQVSAAFQHVHAFTGSFNDLRPLFNERVHSDDLRPLSVHFTHPDDAYDFKHFPTVTFLAERLHLQFDVPTFLSSDDLSRFRTRFLILDIHYAAGGEAMLSLDQLLGVQTLERILVRPSAPWHKSSTQVLRDRVRSFAETKRSTAIWFDSSFPACRGHVRITTSEIDRYRCLSDAMLGDDLWLRGSQMYVPGSAA
ncbi:hypothetical protein EXIGLDRAFT_725828 [Exidia glandulosa HHB12029]|uniref:F-box domain-containing protein n=1 Tax=Exidia glandulosa HHB12029 TaxID=1314781 RepID=A0A165QC36_EXIGL|nr:hypothetical protein EXIGLDRAFT_725828 [Exidia glandulosa HHB12029]